jgi:hypothetical protein
MNILTPAIGRAFFEKNEGTTLVVQNWVFKHLGKSDRALQWAPAGCTGTGSHGK